MNAPLGASILRFTLSLSTSFGDHFDTPLTIPLTVILTNISAIP